MNIAQMIKASRNLVKYSALGLAAAAMLGAGTAQASSITWTGGVNGNWNTTTENWTGDSTTFTPNNGSVNVIFDNAAGGTINIASAMSPASITVSAGDYTFSGNAVASGSLTKSGGGTLQLNVTPANFSSISVTGGTLYLFAAGNYHSDEAPFNMGTGSVTVESGATLIGERANMAGTLTMNGGTWLDNNGFGGSWTGPVTLSADSFFGRDGWCCDQTITGEISGTGVLTKLGGGARLTLNGTSTYTSKTIVRSGTLAFTIPLSDAGVAGPLGAPTGANAVIDLHAGATLIYTGNQHPTQHGTWSNNRPLNLAGDSEGTVSLNGANINDTHFEFNGPITATGIGKRTLNISSVGDRPQYIYNGGIPDMSDASPVTVSLFWSSGSSSSDGKIYLNGNNTFSGPLTLNGGNNGGPGTFSISNTGSLGYGKGAGGINDYAGQITFTANPATVVLDYASSTNQTLSGAISGPGALTLSGTGMLTLSGTNTYSGDTTVNAGCKLQLTHLAALGTETSVYLSDTAELKMDFAAPGMDQVAKLFVNGAEQPKGLYKAVGSSGAGTALAQITGTGKLMVGTPLIADFAATPGTTGEASFSVTFTDNSRSILGTITNWLWNFGDGTTSSVQNPPTHTYALWGTYTVTLTVIDDKDYSAIATKVIIVTQPLDLVVSSAGQYETVSVNVDPAGSVTFNTDVVNPVFGGLTGKGGLTLANSSGGINLEVGGSGPNTKYDGALTGSGGLTKVGANTFSLTSTNSTYSGDTIVNNGILAILGEVLNPGLAVQFVQGEDSGPISDQTTFNEWLLSRTQYLTTTTTAYPGGSGYYAAPARLWYPNDSQQFKTLGFNTANLSSLSDDQVNNNYTVSMTGKIKITTGGAYQFGLNSDDGSMLWIDGVNVVNNNYYQGMIDQNNPKDGGGQARGSIDLAAGYHDIQIGMYEGGGGHGLNVSYQGPDTAADDGSPTGNPQNPSQGNVDGWVFIPNSVLGVLTTGGNNVLPASTTLRINSPGKLNIAGGTHTITRLYLDGVLKKTGTWGSTASSAEYQNDTYFSGTGILNVTGIAGTVIIME